MVSRAFGWRLHAVLPDSYVASSGASRRLRLQQ